MVDPRSSLVQDNTPSETGSRVVVGFRRPERRCTVFASLVQERLCIGSSAVEISPANRMHRPKTCKDLESCILRISLLSEDSKSDLSHPVVALGNAAHAVAVARRERRVLSFQRNWPASNLATRVLAVHQLTVPPHQTIKTTHLIYTLKWCKTQKVLNMSFALRT